MMFSRQCQQVSREIDKRLIEPRKILIIQTAFIGDVVLTTPLIREVKNLFPLASLDVLVIPQTQNVLQNNPHLHSLITFDKRGDKKRAFRDIARQLAERRYDLCLIPHRSFTSALLAVSAKIPLRIGFAGRIPSLLYHIRVPFDVQKNQINRYLDLLRVIKDKEYDFQTELYPSPHDIDCARTQCARLDAKHKIAVAPGSVWPTKRWPEQRFTALVQKLVQHDIGIVLIGSRQERDLCDAILQQAGSDKIINLAGQTRLLEAAAVIQCCDLLICNDSGAMHFANAVRTDVYAFFGPTVRRFGFAPFRAQDVVFEVELDCRPCSAHGGRKCPQKHFRCMLDISADTVYQHVAKRLNVR
ncbi:lipopolysaccharide heptosyltransferase II [candidate division KSB1 bacterium]|nr:lipopolysaccharide heptosyltransferase II [candidate division KSB1 bacterium]